MMAFLEMFAEIWRQKGIVGVLVVSLHISIGLGAVLWVLGSMLGVLARAVRRGIRRARTRRFLQLQRGGRYDYGGYSDPATHRRSAPVRRHGGGDVA